MPSKLHDKVIKEAQNLLISEGRILRLDSKINPDLIFISKNGEVSAVEIELSHAGISEVKTNLEKYSDFDNILIFRLIPEMPYICDFKAKRYYPKEFFEKVLNLTKEGKSQLQIAKELQIEFKRVIPQSTISMIQNGRRKWSKNRKEKKFRLVRERIITQINSTQHE